MKWFESIRDPLRERYVALEMRERRMVLAAIVAISLTLVFLVVVDLLAQHHARLQSSIDAKREQVAWMRAATEALRERAPSSRPATRSNGSLLAMTDSSARAAGLAQPLKRIQQDGNDAVRVRLESASFDQLVVWLDELERRHGVVATEMTVDRADGDGLVNASLTLSRAPS